MPRNGAGAFANVPGTTVTASTTILSSWANGFTADVESTFNTAWPVSLGGTGGTSAATARDALGLEIGVDIPNFASVSGLLYGLTLSNNVTDATNDIDIATGRASNSTNTDVMTLGSVLTKRLDAGWAVGTNQGGLDTGSIANTTYHVFLIKRVDTGVVDALFSASASSPTMPANYTLSRRIGSIVRVAGVIKPFVQSGSLFVWSTPVTDVNVTNPGTSTVNRTLTVPTGILVTANISYVIFDTGALGSSIALYISSLSQTDITASSNGPFTAVAIVAGVNNIGASGQMGVLTDAAAGIRTNINASGAATIFRISTNGFIDTRAIN